MEHDFAEIINPVIVDSVVSGSVTIISSPDVPGKIIVKIQAMAPDDPTSRHTFLFYLDRPDAMKLHETLSLSLSGTAN